MVFLLGANVAKLRLTVSVIATRRRSSRIKYPRNSIRLLNPETKVIILVIIIFELCVSFNVKSFIVRDTTSSNLFIMLDLVKTSAKDSGRHKANLYYTFLILMQVSLITPWSRFCIDGGFLLRAGGDTVAMVTLVPALSACPWSPTSGNIRDRGLGTFQVVTNLQCQDKEAR